ncbi:hypothetical protein GQ457_01G035640 [Hibiscus cannabinus]
MESSNKNSVRWADSSSRVFSTKSYCELIRQNGGVTDVVWKFVWANLAPPKVETFFWRVVLNRLATMDELHMRGVALHQSQVCLLCLAASESVNHFGKQPVSQLTKNPRLCSTVSTLVRQGSWSPPPKGFVKFNTDGAGLGGFARPRWKDSLLFFQIS